MWSREGQTGFGCHDCLLHCPTLGTLPLRGWSIFFQSVQGAHLRDLDISLLLAVVHASKPLFQQRSFRGLYINSKVHVPIRRRYRQCQRLQQVKGSRTPASPCNILIQDTHIHDVQRFTSPGSSLVLQVVVGSGDPPASPGREHVLFPGREHTPA